MVENSLNQLIKETDTGDCDLIMFDSESRQEINNALVDRLHYIKNPTKIMSGEVYLRDAEVPWVPWITLFKKDFLRRNSIQFAEGVRFEDTDYMLKCVLLANRVKYTPINAVCHVINTSSTVHIGNDYKKIEERFLTFERIHQTISHYQESHPVGVEVIKKHYAHRYSALLRRTLWRLKYSNICKILEKYPNQVETNDRIINIVMMMPKTYAIVSQFVRPALLNAVRLRNILRHN